MTVHKAQGQTLRVVGWATPYHVVCSRVTSLNGLSVSRDFGGLQVKKRQSEPSRVLLATSGPGSLTSPTDGDHLANSR